MYFYSFIINHILQVFNVNVLVISAGEYFTLFLTTTGSIIRCMRRLEELLREMCHAAKAIGNTELENIFAAGICISSPW